MRIQALKAITLAIVLVGAAACGVKKQTSTVSPGVVFQATCEDAIVTYATRSEVPADYYEVAWVEAEGNSIYTTDNKLQENIRNGAAKVGATAVIVNPVEQSKTTYKVLGEAVATHSATQKASALAIYVPSDANRVRTACGK
jgi:hypothetical protein